MKLQYILIVVVLMSCSQGTKEKDSIVNDSNIDKKQIVELPQIDSPQKVEHLTANKISKEDEVQTTSLNDLALIDSAINQLGLNKSKIKTDLITSKTRPNHPNETIIVIPEIVHEEEGYVELNDHIIILNNKTGEIINQNFKGSKTNGWTSDAVRLADIKIDTAPYNVSENERTFGIRVNYYNSSKPNPYSYESISLYITTDDSLKKILDEFNVMEYHGEWDTECYGDFVKEEKVLILSQNKTNGYFDILVKNKITETQNRVDENGECDYIDKVNTLKTVLKFNNKEYKLELD